MCGDNSTCLDCANVPNGPNITDLCGNCKQTSDPTYNVGCGTKLGKLHPLVVAYGNINIGISIPASTLANVVNTTCMFNSTLAESSKMETKGRVSTVTAATPANLTAGTYTVTCTFFGTTTVTTTAKNTLTVVNVGAMSLTSISPSVSLVKSTVKLSITGTGFVNSPELACKYGNRKVPATF